MSQIPKSGALSPALYVEPSELRPWASETFKQKHLNTQLIKSFQSLKDERLKMVASLA